MPRASRARGAAPHPQADGPQPAPAAVTARQPRRMFPRALGRCRYPFGSCFLRRRRRFALATATNPGKNRPAHPMGRIARDRLGFTTMPGGYWISAHRIRRAKRRGHCARALASFPRFRRSNQGEAVSSSNPPPRNCGRGGAASQYHVGAGYRTASVPAFPPARYCAHCSMSIRRRSNRSERA